MIILIEGPRNSGKTHLIKSLEQKDFKFPFDFWFDMLGFSNESKEIHAFAISKEIMLHQLNREGYFSSRTKLSGHGSFKLAPVIADRGIISTWVWGILQKRISREEALRQIDLWNSQKLFEDTKIVIVVGNKLGLPDERTKDAWDGTDTKVEKEIYDFILEHIVKSGIEVTQVVNSFDESSIENFKATIQTCVES